MPIRLYSGRVIPSLLLAAVLAAAAVFLSRTDLGGINTDSGRLSIVTRYYGVTADEIERIITIPMEEAAGGLPGIEELRASSEFSVSRIDLLLSPSTDIDDFVIELREQVDRTYTLISRNSPAIQKPLIVDSGVEQQAVFSIAFSKPGMLPTQLRPVVENEIKPSYARIPGLGEIDVTGGAMPEIHVEVDPERAAALDYNSSDIASILQNANLYTTAGRIDNGYSSVQLSVDARLKTLGSLRSLPLSTAHKLSDLAAINYASREQDSISRLGGKERISLYIKSSSPKLITISKLLREETERWAEKGWKTEIIHDRGAELEKSFWKVAAALIIGMIVSSLVLLLFNVSFRRVLLLLAGQPAILLTSLGLLAAAGFSPDQYLLAGLAVGTGMILDSALLITDRIDSSAGLVSQIFPPLISATLSSLIALLPVFRLKDEIPGMAALVTALAAMLGASLVLSIIFIPPFYRRRTVFRRGPLLKQLIKARSFILNLSKTTTASKIPAVLVAGLLITAAGTAGVISLPIRLNQLLESPVVHAQLELDEGESLASSDFKMRQLTDHLEEIPFITAVQSSSKRSGGMLSVRFDEDASNRPDVVNLLREYGRTIPGGFVYIPEAQDDDNLRLKISISGPDSKQLKKLARSSLGLILKNDWALEGVLHFKEDPPAYHFIPDNDALAEAGLTVAAAAGFLRWNLQGPVADKWLAGERELDMRVMASDSCSLSASDLCGLKIHLDDQETASRLDQLGRFIKTTDSSRINRLNRQHAESFSVNCRKSDPVKLNSMIWDVLETIDLPEGYTFIPSQELVRKQDFYRRLWLQFGFAVVLIFLLLSVERESLKQALLILMPLPVILALPPMILRIKSVPIGTETILGLILLSGMGINNGILIIDRLSDGVHRAVKTRFNGLFLTTITSTCGMLPLLFTGNQFFINLSTVLISGLAGSFLISIFIFPALLVKLRIKESLPL